MYSNLKFIKYLATHMEEFKQALILYLGDVEEFDRDLHLDFCDLYALVVSLEYRLNLEISKEHNLKGE